jgi:hypothetical protein
MASILHAKLVHLPYNNYWSQYKYQNTKWLRKRNETNTTKGHSDLLQDVKNKDVPQPVIKLSVLGTSHILYSQQDGFHIYTDDSLMDTNGNADAENHCNLSY